MSGVRYFTRDIYPTLGLLTTAGLLAAAVVLYLFAGLAEEVIEGDTSRFDQTALAGLNRFASPPLTSFMRAVTYLGSVAFLMSAGACAVLAFVLARWRRAIIAFLVTMAGATLLNVVLKLAFRRERPEPFFGTPLPESYSFPSGHALLSFCFYGVIAAVITAHRRYGAARLRLGRGSLASHTHRDLPSLPRRPLPERRGGGVRCGVRLGGDRGFCRPGDGSSFSRKILTLTGPVVSPTLTAHGYCQHNGNFPCDTATECGHGPSGVPEVAAVKAQIWLS